MHTVVYLFGAAWVEPVQMPAGNAQVDQASAVSWQRDIVLKPSRACLF